MPFEMNFNVHANNKTMPMISRKSKNKKSLYNITAIHAQTYKETLQIVELSSPNGIVLRISISKPYRKTKRNAHIQLLLCLELLYAYRK